MDSEYRWLLAVGGPSALAEIGPRLPVFYGSGACPICGNPFVLRQEFG